MIEFEWDARKARENARKHGVTFEQATAAFKDPRGVEWIDDAVSYGEERNILLARVPSGLLVVVVHTDRSTSGDAQRVRIISARRATRNEKNFYVSENS